MRRQKILVYFGLGDYIKINNDVMGYDPFNQIKIHKSILEISRERRESSSLKCKLINIEGVMDTDHGKTLI